MMTSTTTTITPMITGRSQAGRFLSSSCGGSATVVGGTAGGVAEGGGPEVGEGGVACQLVTGGGVTGGGPTGRVGGCTGGVAPVDPQDGRRPGSVGSAPGRPVSLIRCPPWFVVPEPMPDARSLPRHPRRTPSPTSERRDSAHHVAMPERRQPTADEGDRDDRQRDDRRPVHRVRGQLRRVGERREGIGA